jgi:formate dehydrogenase major subunit
MMPAKASTTRRPPAGNVRLANGEAGAGGAGVLALPQEEGEAMTMELSRRGFLKAGGGAALASSAAVLGFGDSQIALAETVRPYKLAQTTETRSTCPYCSVSCGALLYSRTTKDGKLELMHVEGDADNPVNRGTLCPRGAGILDFVNSNTRVLHPMHRKAGSDKFERVTWDFAVERIAKLMKADRDANFMTANKDGATVNRWATTAMFVSSAMTNEAGYLGVKLARSAGMVALETQARI